MEYSKEFKAALSAFSGAEKDRPWLINYFTQHYNQLNYLLPQEPEIFQRL